MKLYLDLISSIVEKATAKAVGEVLAELQLTEKVELKKNGDKTEADSDAEGLADVTAGKQSENSNQFSPDTSPGETIRGIRKAAAFIGCSPNAFSDLVEQGKIPYFKIGTNHRFRRCDLEAYKAGRVVL